MTGQYSESNAIKEMGRKYATSNLKAFLNGKKNGNWIIGTLRAAVYSLTVPIEDLEQIFFYYKEFGDPDRWQEAYKLCQDEGWFPAES